MIVLLVDPDSVAFGALGGLYSLPMTGVVGYAARPSAMR